MNTTVITTTIDQLQEPIKVEEALVRSHWSN
jgi:hypothetical protein